MHFAGNSTLCFFDPLINKYHIHMKKFYNKTINYGTALMFSVMMMLAMAGKTNAQGTSCFAYFTYAVNGQVVNFYDTSWTQAGNITSWAWTFGDGTSGTGQYPVHTYNGTGPFYTCLTITSSLGCVDSFCQMVYLNPCNLTAVAVYDSIQSLVMVNATGGTAPYTYLWSNGSNQQATTATQPGVYCCTVTDANMCTATACVTVGGGGGCQAFFVSSPNGIPGTVFFNNGSSGSYTSLLWNFGDGTTSTSQFPTHTYPGPGLYYACLSLYNSGVVCDTYCDSVYVQGSTLGNSMVCGFVFNDPNTNGVLDGGETGISSQLVYLYGNGVQQTTQSNAGNYSFSNLAAGTYTIVACVNPPNSLTVPLDTGGCGYYTVTIGGNDTICGFDYGVAQTSVIIEGTVFIDVNNNGVYDAGDSGIPYQTVQVGTQSAYTNSNGDYSIYFPAGTYTASYTPQGVYAPYSLTTPGSITIAATTIGATYGGNNFGIFIPPGSVNLSVNIIPHTTVTPGFPAWYDIQVCNVGVVPTAATLTMVYDGGLTLDYASPAQSSNNTSTHTLTWNLPAINPGSCDYIWVDFNASSAYVIGTSVIELVNVSPTIGIDIDNSNNTDTTHQIVTGSWDPNNKLSVKTNTIDPNFQTISSVNPNQEIEYTVNFQNMGTAAAQNVVVIDNLSADLDANSFQLIGSSHNGVVTRNGNVVTYTFAGIGLPDYITDEPNSHGFVAFKVNAINGLAAGHQISDFADIYFDFNSAVTTNNAIVTLVNPTGLSEFAEGNAQIAAYPNPVSDNATLQFNVIEKALVKIELIDATGRVATQLVNEQMNADTQQVSLNASSFANGMYVIKLTVNGQSSFSKISINH